MTTEAAPEQELKEIRFQMQIAPSQLKAVEDWGWSRRIRTKAEAIRQLLDIGMAVTSSDEEAMSDVVAALRGLLSNPGGRPTEKQWRAGLDALAKAERRS